MPAATFAVAVTFDIKEGHGPEFLESVKRQAQNSREREAWCHDFHVCSDPENPSRFFLYETYDNAESFEKHRQTPHFADYMKSVSDLIESKQLNTFTIENR